MDYNPTIDESPWEMTDEPCNHYFELFAPYHDSPEIGLYCIECGQEAQCTT